MSDTSNSNSVGLTAPPGVAVLVVASEPGRALLDVVEPLIRAGAAAILVVDDGSSSVRRWVLDRISLEPTVHLLRHSTPLGRGAALKTGMQYFVEHLRHYTGLVTTTSDGRYAPTDVLRVMRALYRSPKLAILGASECRGTSSAFAGPQWASIGDLILGLAFRVLTGISLTDVQTRLRAIPTALVPQLVKIPGSRYEYELAMLLHIACSGYPMAEHAIFGSAEPWCPDDAFRPVSDSFSMLRALANFTPVEPELVEDAVETPEQRSSPEPRSGASRAKQTR